MNRLTPAVVAFGLMMIASSASSGVGITYNTCSGYIPVSANGVFNIDVSCSNPGETVVTGGYNCVYGPNSDPLPVIVSTNTFFGYPIPNGWQTIGQTLESASAAGHTYACVNNSSGTVKVVPGCMVGTNSSPCHNNETCTDLSGQGSPPVFSNPSCEVCISCVISPP